MGAERAKHGNPANAEALRCAENAPGDIVANGTELLECWCRDEQTDLPTALAKELHLQPKHRCRSRPVKEVLGGNDDSGPTRPVCGVGLQPSRIRVRRRGPQGWQWIGAVDWLTRLP